MKWQPIAFDVVRISIHARASRWYVKLQLLLCVFSLFPKDARAVGYQIKWPETVISLKLFPKEARSGGYQSKWLVIVLGFKCPPI